MNVQHFRHDPASPNKECDERQASFDPNYGRSLRALNSHIMPLRLVVTGSIFSLQLGFFYPPDNKAHCDKIKIAGDSHQVYEYSFERIERIGTTYLSVGSIPSQIYGVEYKGVGGKGFTICCDCGAAMPGGDPVVLKDILRPYRSKFNKTRCRHTDTDNVNLGYDFVTDMLVLEFALDRQLIDINPQRNSWLNRAGQSLAEALRLAACQELDIEFTELVTGYRVRHNQNGDFVDVYLYDSLSSGAGYAVSIESSIQKLLTKTRELLAGCSCDSACHKCLKHYRNQYIHSVLDRKAALDLLNWGETGIRASALPDKNQQYLLQSLEQILQISGVHIDVKHDPVRAEGRYSKKKVVVYPAMWTKPVEENTIFVSDAHLKYAKPYALKTILDNL